MYTAANCLCACVCAMCVVDFRKNSTCCSVHCGLLSNKCQLTEDPMVSKSAENFTFTLALLYTVLNKLLNLIHILICQRSIMDGISIGPVLWNKECYSLIHKAVLQQNHSRIEKLLSISPYSLETKTNDKFKLTPLLVAASFGCADTFHFLLELKAKSDARSARDCNAVQCALIQRQVKLVTTLLKHPNFSVFKDVSKLLSADFIYNWELSNALDVFHYIIRNHVTSLANLENQQLYEQQIVDSGVIYKMAVLLETCLTNTRLMVSIGHILMRIIEALTFSDCLFEEVLRSPIIALQLKLSTKLATCEAVFSLLQITSTMMKRGRNNEIMALHAPKVCLEASRSTKDDKVMLHTISCMQKCSVDKKMVEHFHSDGLLQEFSNIFLECTPTIQSLLLEIFSNIASLDEFYRRVILELDVIQKALEILDKRQVAINYDIISLLYTLCQQKGDAETVIKESKKATGILLHMIKYSISAINQRKAFEILWLVVADDAEGKSTLAQLVGPTSLLTMLSMALGNQQVTATTALSLLAPPLYGLQKEIKDNGGIPLLLKVIQTTDSMLVKHNALQVLENCCHDIALRPNKDIQKAIFKENGINVMMKVQVCGIGTPLYMQAMCTIAAASIGNTSIKRMIFNKPTFSLATLLKNFCELDPHGDINAILTAARTITFFTYFHPDAQNYVANTKRINLKPLQHLLLNAKEEIKIEAAFYAIILAPICDKSVNKVETLSSSIRFLVRTLHSALNKDKLKILAQLCICISGLLPMSKLEGIRQAFISLDIVSLLVEVISREDKYCRMTAAIALNYITKDHTGRRVILAYCRRNKDLFETIKDCSVGFTLDQNFVDRWCHFEKNFLRDYTKIEIEDPKHSRFPLIVMAKGEAKRIQVKLAGMNSDSDIKLPVIGKVPDVN